MKFGPRPFVYLSDVILTEERPVETLLSLGKKFGANANAELVQTVWTQAALSIKAQAAKYKENTAKYRPERHNIWLKSVIDQVSGVFPLALDKQREFKESARIELMKVQRYTVPEEVRSFIDTLEQNGILWGVIANDDHLYQAALKLLRLKPFALVSARGNFFKPLPQVFDKAWDRVPRDSKRSTWFIGSVQAPFDNIVSRHMKSVLYTHGQHSDETVSDKDHFRIAHLEELYPHLHIGTQTIGDFDFLDGHEFNSIEQTQLAQEKEQGIYPKLVPRPKNVLLPLGDKEKGIADLMGAPQKKFEAPAALEELAK